MISTLKKALDIIYLNKLLNKFTYDCNQLEDPFHRCQILKWRELLLQEMISITKHIVHFKTIILWTTVVSMKALLRLSQRIVSIKVLPLSIEQKLLLSDNLIRTLVSNFLIKRKDKCDVTSFIFIITRYQLLQYTINWQMMNFKSSSRLDFIIGVFFYPLCLSASTTFITGYSSN